MSIEDLTMPRKDGRSRSNSLALKVIADEIFTNGDRWDMDDMGAGAAAAIVGRLKKHGLFIWHSGHRKTHCKHGHPLAGNRLAYGGCKTCKKLRNQQRRRISAEDRELRKEINPSAAYR